MISSHELLIAIDAGHGGWDNGASWEGRLEKEDNLRLAQEVQKQLEAQGIRVLMTRDRDIYVSLADRAAMANQADADLFISLHRNSYIMPTPTSHGVENFIYLTAPWETAGRAAELVLSEVVNVGVQSNRGVQRGNYYVVRRTIMPAMLLEMGFIINEIDNQLFDEHLTDYAAAIAKGAMAYFGLSFQPVPDTTQTIVQAQEMLNQHFGLGIPISGVFDAQTQKSAVMALQMALNNDFETTLAVDGILGPLTLAAFPNVFPGQQGNVVLALQILLQLNGYDTGGIDGIFGNRTQTAVENFQSARGLHPDGIFGQQTLQMLVG